MAVVELPVCFDAEFGIDLDEVASRTGRTTKEVVRLLTETTFDVERIGFLPGFPYLNGVPAALHLPRRAAPRSRVPAGSVAIANGQLGIYPCASPGGWHLLGRTSATLFDPARVPPSLLQAGDAVRLRSVPRSELAAPPAAARSARSPATGAAVLRVERPGLRTTIEDLGRFGWESQGVAPGGAADLGAMQLANALVGNPADLAVLEAAMLGPTFTCDGPILLAATGAEASLVVDGMPRPCHRAVAVPAGATVQIGRVVRGLRAVVAIAGGIDVPPVLGSRSTHVASGFGGLEGSPLQAGDLVPLGVPSRTSRLRLEALLHGASVERRALSPALLGAPLQQSPPYPVWCTPGDALPLLPAATQAALGDAGVRCLVSALSDRMGTRLAAPLAGTLPGTAAAGRRASAPVQRGTIQLPPDGVPIILGPDHQVTGGYPVLGTVIDADQSTLAQLRPGDALVLQIISAEQAADRNRRAAIDRATALCALHLHR